MSIDRVATNSQAQYLIGQVMQANQALNVSQAQVTSGKVSNDYTGIGSKTSALEGARAAAARADGYVSNTQLALTQTDLQNTQLTSLSDLASQLKQAIVTADANGDGTGLMATAQTVFQQAKQILNSTDASGNYIYGGQIADQPPFTATSLSDLTTKPVSQFFQNGREKKSVLVADGQTQQIGVLASDIGTGLMTTLQALANADTPAGSLNGQLTSTQVSTLTSTAAPAVNKAYVDLNTAAAVNGETYKTLQDAVTSQQSLSTLYKGFVSDIEDVDMSTAISNLNQNQVALQAALKITAQLGQLSLLNYLGTPATTG